MSRRPRTEKVALDELRAILVAWLGIAAGVGEHRWTAANLRNFAYNTREFALEALPTEREIVAALASAIQAGEVVRVCEKRHGRVITFYSVAPSPRGGGA